MEDIKFTEIHVKIEPLATDTNKCRVCLGEGSIEIFGANSSENLCVSIYEIAGIKVIYEDPHPKCLCQTCLALLQDAILFRRTALKSEKILKKLELNPKLVKHETVEARSDSDAQEDAGHVDNKQIIKPQIIVKRKYKKEQPKIHDTIKWSCLICNMQFSTMEELSKHRKKKLCRHTKWACKTCDLTFNKLEDYAAHKQAVHDEGAENKRITCKICNKSYAENYYRRHKAAMHTKDTGDARICDICGRKMSNLTYLARHRATHFFELPFKCTQCPYRGRFSESLKMHMRSHTGERPYQCEHCSSRFISKSNLNKHVLTHNRIYNFRCEVCGKGFYTKRELDLHIKVDHTGLKDHACRICGKCFGYRKQMMKHELKVHKREKLKSGRMPIYLKVENMKQEVTLQKNATVNDTTQNDTNTTQHNTTQNDVSEKASKNDTTQNDVSKNDTTESI